MGVGRRVDVGVGRDCQHGVSLREQENGELKNLSGLVEWWNRLDGLNGLFSAPMSYGVTRKNVLALERLHRRLMRMIRGMKGLTYDCLIALG